MSEEIGERWICKDCDNPYLLESGKLFGRIDIDYADDEDMFCKTCWGKRATLTERARWENWIKEYVKELGQEYFGSDWIKARLEEIASAYQSKFNK